MSSILRYIRSKFYQEPEEFSIEQFAIFDEGNRGGFPSDVCAFDYNNGCVAIGTDVGNVIFYGFRGASWSINLNNSRHERIKIEFVHFVSPNTLLVLCSGFLIIPLQIVDGIITKKEEIQIGDSSNSKSRWSTTHIQRLSEDSQALVFSVDNTIYRIKHKTLQLETLVTAENLTKSFLQENELASITSLPEKPNVLILVCESGLVGVFNESKFVMKLELRNSEDEPIQKLYWSSEKSKNHAYGVSSNNKYTKFEFTSSKDNSISAREIDECNTNQFGPYPCHQVRHFSVCPNSSKEKNDILVYQGGKSSGKYDDRDLVTVTYGDFVEKLELSSEIIGIAAIDGSYDSSKKKGVILICTKCEIIGLDLETENLQMMQPQHFLSINNSTPTTHSRAIDIDENVWNRLETASKVFWETNEMSSRKWPLTFQKKIVTEANHQRAAYRQVYLTGHSNGNICIWTSGGVGMSLLLVIKTSVEFESLHVFDTECDEYYSAEESIVHPARKIGFYDPFDDEEEMCITQVHLDPKSGMIIGTNRGGYIIMYELCETARTLSSWEAIPISCNNSPPDNRKKVLKPRKHDLEYHTGYQIRLKNESELPLVFSMHPSHRITDIVYLHKYHCLTVGSNFGVIMIDVNYGYLVYANAFNDDKYETNTTTTTQFNRFRSLKKSLRKTFRRKKKTPDTTLLGDSIPDFHATNNYEACTSRRIEDCEEAFVERAIEARDDLGTLACYTENSKGTVTCIRVMRFPMIDDKNVDDIIAVGLHEGVVHFFTITEHDVGLRMTFKAEHYKKLSIPHKQPVIYVDITNEEGYFSASTRIVVITEEQIRVYNCQPMVKKDGYKLTAMEGLKIKNGIVARIANKKNSNNYESFVVLVANDGSLRIHSVQKPSLFETRKFIDPIDVMALNSSSLTRDGDVSYLIKSSELQRSTVNLNFRGWDYAHMS